MPNDMAEADLGLRNYIIGGVDGFNFVMQEDKNKEDDDFVVL